MTNKSATSLERPGPLDGPHGRDPQSGGRCCLPGRAFGDGRGVVFASRKPELAEIQASVVPGELLDLAYSLRQKISFFRKLLGDFLFGNFWYVIMKWRRGHFAVKELVVFPVFHSGLRLLMKTKLARIPYTSWGD